MENAHIGIIGGGVGGLISLYECSLRNIKATLYERESDFGGVWNTNSKLKRAHKSTRLNTSSVISSFNVDFTLFQFLNDKYPGQEIDYASCDDFYEYQHAFVERYQLSQMIVYNTEIVEILSGENELEFILKARDVLTKKDKEFVHDYVVISTGLYSNPITPDHPFLSNQLTMNVDNVWHTSHWDPLNIDSVTWDVMNKENVRILIIGSGQSAPEAIYDSLVRLESSRTNFKMFWAPTRQPDKRNIWLLDRYPYGRFHAPVTADSFICRLHSLVPSWLASRKLKKICKLALSHQDNALPNLLDDRVCLCESEIIENAINNGSLKVLPDPISKIYKSSTNQLMFDTTKRNSIPIDAVVIGSGYTYGEVKINGEFILNDKFLYNIPINESCHGRIAILGMNMEIGSSFPVRQMDILWLIHQWFDHPRHLERKLMKLRSEKRTKQKYIRQIIGISLDELAADMDLSPIIWRNLISFSRRQRHLAISFLIGPWSIFQYARPNETKAERITREDFVLFSTIKSFEQCRKDFKFICMVTDILYYFILCSVASGFYFYCLPFLSGILNLF